MKTTLIIPDPVFDDLKRQAAERGTTLSALATDLMRQGLAARPRREKLPPMPTFDGGRLLVDVANHDALYEALNAGRDKRLEGRARK